LLKERLVSLQFFTPRRSPAWRTGFSLAAVLSLSALSSQAAKPVSEPLPAETLTVSRIAPDVTQRVYVADIAISHISDGRIRVFDAQHGKLLGMVSTAYAGNFTVNPAAHELYVATTHLSRSTRGDRTDVLEVHDTDTLGFKYEVILPSKRAQALNYRGLVRTNSTGNWVYVQNATPATSITVVDLNQRKVLADINTPGCWGVLPSATHAMRISMLCGDGKVATITLNEQGQVSERQTTAKLFDADLDAWFHHAEQVGDRYWFLSFKGVLTELDLSGPVATVRQTRNLVDAASARKGWRPGGYQNFAVDPSGQRLVLAMHPKGSEGTHKSPAQELWTFDLASGKRLSTVPGRSTISLTFSRSGQSLYGLDGEHGSLNVWKWSDSGPKRVTSTVAKAGEASMHLEAHD
jgi:methylamine dehydrogenase heavy chain